MVFGLTCHSGKYKPTSKSVTDGRSNHANLQSDSESDENNGDDEKMQTRLEIMKMMRIMGYM